MASCSSSRCLQAARLSRGTSWFYLLLAVSAALVVVLPAFDLGRQTLLGTHHLRTGSYWGWAALQPLPSMYNFGNQVWISERPLTAAQRNGAAQDHSAEQDGFAERPGSDSALPAGATTFWVNHYPTRMMTFGAQRAALVHQPRTMHYYFRSRFGASHLDSHYALVPHRDGSGATTVVVQRLPLED